MSNLQSEDVIEYYDEGVEFLSWFNGFDVLSGGTEGLKKTIVWLLEDKDTFMRKCTAVIVFTEKPKSLLTTGLSKAMSRAQKTRKEAVSIKIAEFLPMLDEGQIESMDSIRRATMMQARNGWPEEFRKISATAISRAACIMQYVYKGRVTKSLAAFKKLYGDDMDKPKDGKLSGQTLQIRKEFVGRFVTSWNALDPMERNKASADLLSYSPSGGTQVLKLVGQVPPKVEGEVEEEEEEEEDEKEETEAQENKVMERRHTSADSVLQSPLPSADDVPGFGPVELVPFKMDVEGEGEGKEEEGAGGKGGVARRKGKKGGGRGGGGRGGAKEGRDREGLGD